jgi:hypothetical protein
MSDLCYTVIASLSPGRRAANADKVKCVAMCFCSILCGSAMAQTPSQWPCRVEFGGDAIRLSAGVSSRIVQKKVLPDISDLKGRKLDSLVVVRVIVDMKEKLR